MGDPIVQDPDYAEVGQRCDTHLTTEDGTVFHVNSELLSRHSNFFNSLFLMDEEAGQTTVIRHIKPDIFQIILKYMSTGEVLLSTENAMHLLVASDFLMIESLLDECRKFVLQNKKEDNLMSYFLTANRIKGLHMEDQFRRYLVMCFEKAVGNSMDDACCLPYEELKYFLSHRSLNVSDEHTIWSVMEAWVQKDPVDRYPLVPGLLRCLSIHEIDEKLASNMISSPIIRSNQIYADTTMGCLSNKTLPQIVTLFRNVPPNTREVRLPRLLHVVAKNFQDRSGAELFLSYDDSLDLWRKVGEVSQRVERILVSGHSVYCLKRVLNRRHELSSFSYDLLRNEERRMTLPHCPDYFVVEVGGSVYAVNFCVNHGGTAIERYVDETDEWLDRRHSMYILFLPDVLSVNGLIYVLGDIGEGDMFMQVYDPARDEWRRVAPPTVRRYGPKSVGYQGKIFLVAGRIDFEDEEDELFVYNYFRDDFEGDQLLDNVEEINEDEENDDSDGSDEVDDLERNPDGDNNAFEDDPPFDNNMEEDELISNAVEVYDPQSNEWVVYPELPFKFFPVCASVVKDRLYVYQDPQRPVTYWDGSGQWKIEEDPSPLFQHEFSAVKDENVVRQIMRRNKEEDLSVWLETGLGKVIP